MESYPRWFDICIVCALPEEAKALLDIVQQQCEGPLEDRTSPRYHYSYRFATLKNDKGELLTLHISWLPRYGPQEMTLHLSRVLEECQPRIAIMTGICAGDAQRVQLGDLVVAERTFTYDNGKFTLDKHGRSVHEHDTMTYQLDANILQFLGLFDDWKPLIASLERPLSFPEQHSIACHIRAMASGSAVRADHPFRDVQVPVRGTVAIDMEGAAFGLVMSRHPLIRWLVVKGVCDYADIAKSDTYHDYAARASALYALSFIQKYVTSERLPQPSSRAELSSIPHTRIRTRMLGFLPFIRTPVGRDRLLLLLKQQLKDPGTPSPVVVLHGQPGVGKTTIVAQLARDDEIHASFSGGVLWADLGEKPSLNDILAVWASQLKADITRVTTIQEKLGLIKSNLGHAPFLLILDDLWLDDPVTLNSLLGMVDPGCASIITTRWRKVADDLGTLVGSKQIFVDELDEKGALTLLMEICQNKPTDRGLLVSLVKAAGGLPLTLQIMGAYINGQLSVALDPMQIRQDLQRIEKQLRLPGATGSRHLSLQEAIDRSVKNLPDRKTKYAFFALGAFAPKPATFSEEAARCVTGADLEILQTLYNSNLLHQSSRDRYMLHQSLTDAARAHLHTNDAAYSRHRIYYQKRVEQMVLIGQGKTDALTNIDWRTLFSDLPQIRAIRLPQRPASIFSIIVNRLSGSISWLRWLDALPIWLKNGLSLILLTGLSLLGKTARVTGQRHIEATLANRQGWLYAEIGDRYHALIHYERACKLLENSDNHNNLKLARVLNNLGKTHYMKAQYRQALKAYHHALTIYRRRDKRSSQAHVLTNIGTTLDMIGRTNWAIESFHTALTLYRALQEEEQDERGEALTLHHLGVAYRGLGEREKALFCLEQALTKHACTSNEVGRARTLMELGLVYLDIDSVAEQEQEQDSLETAMGYFQQALELQKKFGDLAWQGRTVSRIGLVYAKQGKTAKALEAYLQALSIHQNVNYHAGLSATLGFISNLFSEAGKDIWAQDIADKAKSEHAHIESIFKQRLKS